MHLDKKVTLKRLERLLRGLHNITCETFTLGGDLGRQRRYNKTNNRLCKYDQTCVKASCPSRFIYVMNKLRGPKFKLLLEPFLRIEMCCKN